MPFIERKESLNRLRQQVTHGKPIIGAGAGTGITAKFSERGGVDLIIIYNSGRYRMAGRGSLSGLLAYGNANEIVVEMAAEVLPGYQEYAGFGGSQRNGSFLPDAAFLKRVKRNGV